MAKSAHRSLSETEKSALFAALETMEAVRSMLWKLKDLGWEPPHQVSEFDNAMEVIRAVATDTRSLVREGGPSY